MEKLEALKSRWGKAADRIVPVRGDLTKPRLGIPAAKRRELEGKIDHVFHLAAIYDLKADAESQEITNNKGTLNTIRFAEAVQAKRFPPCEFDCSSGPLSGRFP